LDQLISTGAAYVVGLAMLFGGIAASSAILLYLGLAVLLLGGTAGQIVLTVQVGKTGQSWGMRRVGIRCIGEVTGHPIGVGPAILRYLCHIVDSLALSIGWIRPAWNAKRQTFADSICRTIVVVDRG
jgi:uncharacterized RDD family membrane protein YckC